MKERGIIMQGDSVIGILEGRKSQTRRVIKPQPEYQDYMNKPSLHWSQCGGRSLEEIALYCPYGQPSDRLWVRETWMPFTEAGVLLHEAIYKATDRPEPDGDTPLKWRPSIFMPRWASRITLEIVNVRAERVQDISEEGAKAEGCNPWFPNDPKLAEIDKRVRDRHGWEPNYRNSYHALWDSINAKRGYGWDVNPYVWVIEFKVLP